MKLKYFITGIDCPTCATKLASDMNAIDGITSAKINFLTEKLTVETELSEEDALSALTNAARAFSKEVKITK